MYSFCANLQHDIFTFMLGDVNKENSIPATSDAQLNAKKNYSKRNNTLKKYKISISVVQMTQSTLVCFKIHIMGKTSASLPPLFSWVRTIRERTRIRRTQKEMFSKMRKTSLTEVKMLLHTPACVIHILWSSVLMAQFYMAQYKTYWCYFFGLRWGNRGNEEKTIKRCGGNGCQEMYSWPLSREVHIILLLWLSYEWNPICPDFIV